MIRKKCRMKSKRNRTWADNFPMVIKTLEYPRECEMFRGFMGHKLGCFVAVTPCGDKYGGKTYLGIYLGNAPYGFGVFYNTKSQALKVYAGTNPAMLIPELGEVVWGRGSWWREIKSAEDLKPITQSDINSQWDVMALKALDKPTA